MSIKWDLQAITGMSRWLLRVWSLCHGHINSTTQKAKVQWPDQMKRKMLSEKHETIQKVFDVHMCKTYRMNQCELQCLPPIFTTFKKSLTSLLFIQNLIKNSLECQQKNPTAYKSKIVAPIDHVRHTVHFKFIKTELIYNVSSLSHRISLFCFVFVFCFFFAEFECISICF